jgi:hypothetical protein
MIGATERQMRIQVWRTFGAIGHALAQGYDFADIAEAMSADSGLPISGRWLRHCYRSEKGRQSAIG